MSSSASETSTLPGTPSREADAEPGGRTGTAWSAAVASDRCMNCQAPLQGAYCYRCGQSAQTQRLRFPQLVRSLLQGLFDLDSKTLRTVWNLFTRPGSMVREYVEGNRVTYLSALRYYVLVIALAIGLSALFGMTGVTSAGMDNGNVFRDAHFVTLQISLLYAVIAIPIAASQWLLRRSGRLSVAEHYAFLLYLLAQSILVMAIIDVVAMVGTGAELSGDREGLIWLGAFTAYVVWAGRTFYQEAAWHTAWKTAVSYMATVVMVGSCIAAGIGLYRLLMI